MKQFFTQSLIARYPYDSIADNNKLCRFTVAQSGSVQLNLQKDGVNSSILSRETLDYSRMFCRYSNPSNIKELRSFCIRKYKFCWSFHKKSKYKCQNLKKKEKVANMHNTYSFQFSSEYSNIRLQ